MSNNQDGASALQVGRYGLIGAVLGALIGGIGSFSGAFLTYQEQRDTRAIETKRIAYVALISEAEQYRKRLGRVIDAAREEDQATYREERDTLLSEASVELYSAATSVYVIGEVSVSDKANAVLASLFDTNEPLLVKEYDVGDAERATAKGREALDIFQRAAREDLLKED